MDVLEISLSNDVFIYTYTTTPAYCAGKTEKKQQYPPVFDHDHGHIFENELSTCFVPIATGVFLYKIVVHPYHLF